MTVYVLVSPRASILLDEFPLTSNLHAFSVPECASKPSIASYCSSSFVVAYHCSQQVQQPCLACAGEILTDVSKYRFPKPDVAEKSRLPPVLLDAETLKQLKFCLSPGASASQAL